MIRLEPFPGDELIFSKINALGRESLDYVYGWPTHFGDPTILIVVAAIYILIWDEGKAAKNIATVAAATIAGWLTASLIKEFIFRPRPYAFYQELIDTGKFKINALFGLLQQESSFPSGHTTTVFAYVTALNLIYGKKLRPLYILAVFVGFTRIYVARHFPSDVAAGAVLGILVGWAAHAVIMKISSGPRLQPKAPNL